LIVRIRTPELVFSTGKTSEAVPRPNASDGEHLSRGRIPPFPQSEYFKVRLLRNPFIFAIFS